MQHLAYTWSFDMASFVPVYLNAGVSSIRKPSKVGQVCLKQVLHHAWCTATPLLGAMVGCEDATYIVVARLKTALRH